MLLSGLHYLFVLSMLWYRSTLSLPALPPPEQDMGDVIQSIMEDMSKYNILS